ncbi:MAG: Fur family transcriptional regulator [Melioribacteraceae bacterium]|jgi:Fur family peroxide stress response transcriptional regulator|nr:Fur family transcriptional regulator [Melioribacteraceae bacterium]
MIESTIENISKILHKKGVSPSIQRIKIMQFILNNEHHSSVDSIYQKLIHEIPTLSKTTVYNTLALFAEKKIINSITIDNTEILYEQSQKPHAHFQCNICKNIIDIDLDSNLYGISEIENHKVEKVNINLRGVCNECLKSKK